MAEDWNSANWVGRLKPGLGEGTLTDEAKEAKFQLYLEQERVAVAAGKPAPPAASWPIEKRRELFMRRYQ
jgi:hypothetical protein